MKVQFYYADEKYIDFLKSKELEKRGFTCVPDVVYSNRNKFLYGAVLKVNSVNYYVPISSKTGKNQQYNLDIKSDDKNNKKKGSLRFPYMIPVPAECLIKLDVKKVPDFNEKARISKELAFCRRNKDKIEKYAQITYNDVTNQKNDKLVRNACDFKLLEKACIEYCTEHGFDLPGSNV
ncbi:MAG: type III toxin-antitoxin system ToxN/AbiQ family toxin [Oscillospiraceae bacterium]|nr:type III toxin-antitoxin system ToxN/AbiQ family toxin [Oscillospiraceae bacterium]